MNQVTKEKPMFSLTSNDKAASSSSNDISKISIKEARSWVFGKLYA
jgi:hypothetical protein